MPTADRPACSAVSLSVGFEYFLVQPVMGQALLPAALFTEPVLYPEVHQDWQGFAQGHHHVMFLGLLKVKTRENVFFVLFCFLFLQKRHTMRLAILLR